MCARSRNLVNSHFYDSLFLEAYMEDVLRLYVNLVDL